MDREGGREVGEGSSMSSREQRNLREQERRMRMKHLFNILSSHVSPTHRVLISFSSLSIQYIVHIYIWYIVKYTKTILYIMLLQK